VRIGLVAGSLGGLWVLFARLGESWWQLVVAVGLAVVFAQAGFIGHDAGHRQIARARRANDLIGLVHGNLVTGLSYGWWVDKHNRHHAHPNTEGRDP
jgi:fatty acid desaturase